MQNRIYMFSPVVLWIVVLTASLMWNIRTIDKRMVETVNSIGRSFFKEIETTRLWNARHGGVYVSITENTQPNPYLEVPNRDVTTTEGLQLTKINPAFMTRQIAEIAKVESNIQYHITSLKPIRPANKPDEWETKTLKGFEAGNKELFGFIRDAMVYRYMAPLPVKKACLKCHAKHGYQLGDVRGGISVTIPAREYIDTVQASKNILIIIHAIVLVLGIGVFYFFKKSRDKQMELKDKKTLALEQSRTAAELVAHQEHLEELVKQRTDELEDSRRAALSLMEDAQIEQERAEEALENLKRSEHELSEANKELKKIDHLKSMFIASMSHELRTPLNSIIGFTGVIIQGMTGPLNDKQQDHLTRVYNSAKHLLSLITDVIDISKIEAGRIDVFPQDIILSEIVDEAVVNIEPQLKAKNLELKMSVPENLQMHTDRKRLLQSIINYLSNAVKFTEVGSVKITAKKCDEKVEILVTDTGIGISQQDQSKLFEAFERLDSKLRIKAGGTGLGLYLTHKLATEILGGKVLVQSQEGKGSTFGLLIPINIDPVDRQQKQNEEDNL